MIDSFYKKAEKILDLSAKYRLKFAKLTINNKNIEIH